MLRNLIQLEHVIGEKPFRFICAPDAPIQQVKDALLEFLKYVGKIEDEVRAQTEAIKAKEEAEKAAAASEVEQELVAEVI